VSQSVVALSPPSFEFLRLIPGFADQDRYEGDDEEGRVEVGDKVRFAVGVVREDCLRNYRQLSLAKCIVGLCEIPYTGQEVGDCPEEDGHEQEQQADRASPLRPTRSLHIPTAGYILLLRSRSRRIP
jgi:hypothetical protein